ncbi:MAG: hypothetical protein MJA27_17420 [Pseudanabaenales cyanobacterium]|nr:hypothetical protein [Pseudanabaenales cyanobacterium]
MFAKIPERMMHFARWGLAIGWLILIASLFYDPISAYLSEPHRLFGPESADVCFEFQGKCQPLTPYPLGARIFWGMVVPLSILILLVLGHEAWRRICPLSFFSQIPRALGWRHQRLVKEHSWLSRNHSYLQFFLLFLGLNVRLLLVNSDRLLLGFFLLFTILSAIAVGLLYGGKTWCNYFCPMAPVQSIYSEPSSLLTSVAHTAPPRSITQSMCRTVNQSGLERSACVACKSACMDIDAENSYWSKIHQPDQKLMYYAYLGLAVGFYLYFWLYSGNWNFLSAGVWNETNQLSSLLSPGFYLNGSAIAIPKLVAVPLTLTLFSSVTYVLGLRIEKAYKRYNKKFKRPLPLEQVHHQLFTLFSFAAFNALFFLGVRPTLGWLPLIVQQVLSWGAILASSLWMVKIWRRSENQYSKERDGNLLRRQLQKMAIDFPQFLDGRSLEELNPDELYALARVLPGFSHQYRLQVYSGVLKESLGQSGVRPSKSLKVFQDLRQGLGINDVEHHQLVDQLCQDHPDLFAPNRGQTSNLAATAKRNFNRDVPTANFTIRRPFRSVRTSAVAEKNLPVRQPTKSETEPTLQRSWADMTRVKVSKRDREK